MKAAKSSEKIRKTLFDLLMITDDAVTPKEKRLPKSLPMLFPLGVVVRFRAVCFWKSNPKARRTSTSEVCSAPDNAAWFANDESGKRKNT